MIHTFTAQHPDDIGMIEKESPIEDVEVREVDGEYFLTFVSRLPLGSICSKFNGYKIKQRFSEHIVVTVTHMEISEKNVPCTKDYPAVVTEIPLGGDFESGRTYMVLVNGIEATFPEIANTQTGDSDTSGSGTPEQIVNETIEVQAPIEGSTIVEPETHNNPYILKITSGLPSGCAQFNAYHSSLRGNDYSIEVTNRIPADQTIACTAIYGYYEGQFTLGDGALKTGETYTVTINGELAHTFVAR
ncbi:MAG: hypothetical protein O2913_11665 [Chloroflexi bacterium]|nr:hypothetical protein [Chloroflexota bacterium]